MGFSKIPKKQGLYDPEFEKDSCGVGFVANMKNQPSHEIVVQGLEILKRLEHRGACGSDPLTGDGAGILIQIPHRFFKGQCSKLGFELPEPGKYGTGLVFLSRDEAQAQGQIKILEEIIKQEGQNLLGWRDVPVDNSTIGSGAREVEPVIRQVFIGSHHGTKTGAEFERKLYCIRKQTATAIRKAGLNRSNEEFYVVSLSAKTFIYKGQLTAPQLEMYFLDIQDTELDSALALAHSRYSTNTFPAWHRAQPFRFMAHNGEINTIRGNKNWMRAREALFDSPLYPDIKKILPVIADGGSDSADFDQALEMLVLTDRSIPHSVMMMIPEPWSANNFMDPEKKGFYEYHASIMEPWDGPASIAFTDGDVIGAVLDRNGLRPSRYIVTKDNLVVMASEVGVLPIPESQIVSKGRLQPGKMFLVDLREGRIISDSELKAQICTQRPYAKWVEEQQVNLEDLPPSGKELSPNFDDLSTRQGIFGYTVEDLKIVLAPMVQTGMEATGSMGNDAALAVRSEKPQLLFNYFKQLFAQVTNPAIDSIREEIIMSTELPLGRELNLLEETPEHCKKLKIPHPVLSPEEFEKIKILDLPDIKSATLSTLVPVSQGEEGFKSAIDDLCKKASEEIKKGSTILILSDRGADEKHAPIPSLLAVSAVHHHLLRVQTRNLVDLVAETGEAREMMHFALLIGYGAGAIYPYLAYDTVASIVKEGVYLEKTPLDQAIENYIKSTRKGLLKIIAKMGISTLRSYRGAQIFEAVGLNEEFIEKYFKGTPSRVSGVGLEAIARESFLRHKKAFLPLNLNSNLLEPGGQYAWRRGEEQHMYNPSSIAALQHSVRSGDYSLFKKFSQQADAEATRQCTLRGLFKIKEQTPIPIEEVEPVSEIAKRFCTGAMSIGSISRETHETLAIAMNRLGGKSNTGEGGEDAVRYVPDANGDSRNSYIKQVASGRFGVNSFYLTNAREMQIKVAQGAKPGEGGQLPGHKVSEYIARIRHSTPGVGLISPPPHHDIYSIEDLQQLIFDLHNANPSAGVSVKLVSEAGVGTIAAGVSKAHADGVLISGHDGGTGASPQTSIKHAGLPWELGLAETQQVLVMNDLRGRIRVQVDGQLKTGRDVIIGALLGADEFGFSTAPLITLGCILMRKCHLNTCSVGIATQDPELRKKFKGDPQHVVNFFNFVAEEVREIMAQLGVRKLDEIIGKTELLEMDGAVDHWKSKGLDFSRIFHKPDVPPHVAKYHVVRQDLRNDIIDVLDRQLIRKSRSALDRKEQVRLAFDIKNTDRAVGAMLSYEVSKNHGEEGLAPDTIVMHFKGSAGQSFGAFLAPGITFTLEGDANDYLGKGLSGGKIVAYPAKDSTFIPEKNMIAGNVLLYGGIAGKVFLRGMAGERFAIRNSGVEVVVEGVGDHGCEYMTGGTVVVLGETGKNFAAGMSGGLAYVLDSEKSFQENCNHGLVDLFPLEDDEDIEKLRSLIEEHFHNTYSTVARKILNEWEETLPQFLKVYPRDYRHVLEERRKRQEEENGKTKMLGVA